MPKLLRPWTREEILTIRFAFECYAAEMERRGHQGSAKETRAYCNHHYPLEPA